MLCKVKRWIKRASKSTNTCMHVYDAVVCTCCTNIVNFSCIHCGQYYVCKCRFCVCILHIVHKCILCDWEQRKVHMLLDFKQAKLY